MIDEDIAWWQITIMVKTQVQIPETLYQRAKEIAKEREISLAEVMRRGLEYMSRTHPPIPCPEVKLPTIMQDRFVDDFDEINFREFSAHDEVKPVS